MDKPQHAWMVRAGGNNELADLVEDAGAIAIAWGTGDLSELHTREEIKNRYRQTHPDHSDTRIAVNGGQLFRFAQEIKKGDYILTYIKASRELLIGLIERHYEYQQGVFPGGYNHLKRVRWMKRVSRDSFSAPARNSMGSSLTVFSLNDHLDEIHKLATTMDPAAPEDDEEAPPFFEEVKGRADELIADIISKLDPYDFQDLVAAVLESMGYRAVSHPPGADGGVDIVAHPDALGFGQPKIKVQVKHRKGTVGGPELRAFLATLRSGESGLYVSTGDFTNDARREAETAREPTTLLEREGFIRLLLENYEELDPEFKAKVPLRKLWVPAE